LRSGVQRRPPDAARIELPGRTFMVDTGGSGMTSILISGH
jgi:hypothetical protein